MRVLPRLGWLDAKLHDRWLMVKPCADKRQDEAQPTARDEQSDKPRTNENAHPSYEWMNDKSQNERDWETRVCIYANQGHVQCSWQKYVNNSLCVVTCVTSCIGCGLLFNADSRCKKATQKSALQIKQFSGQPEYDPAIRRAQHWLRNALVSINPPTCLIRYWPKHLLWWLGKRFIIANSAFVQNQWYLVKAR